MKRYIYAVQEQLMGWRSEQWLPVRGGGWSWLSREPSGAVEMLHVFIWMVGTHTHKSIQRTLGIHELYCMCNLHDFLKRRKRGGGQAEEGEEKKKKNVKKRKNSKDERGGGESWNLSQDSDLSILNSTPPLPLGAHSLTCIILDSLEDAFPMKSLCRISAGSDGYR